MTDSQRTAEEMTLQAALLLASVCPDDPGDLYHVALKRLGVEYHKQALLVARQANQLRQMAGAAMRKSQ